MKCRRPKVCGHPEFAPEHLLSGMDNLRERSYTKTTSTQNTKAFCSPCSMTGEVIEQGQYSRLLENSNFAASSMNPAVSALNYDNYDMAGWLSPGVRANHHITIRPAQKVFTQAPRNAKVRKSASIHIFQKTGQT
jgi:hypothetical protein